VHAGSGRHAGHRIAEGAGGAGDRENHQGETKRESEHRVRAE
jgi:hypothetical protein